MSSTTKKILDNLMDTIGNKELTYAELDKALLLAGGLSMKTFRRYAQVEETVVEIRDETSLQDVLDLLNSCAGDDCYYCDWNYQLIDGKIYNVKHITYYKMIGIN